MSIGFKFQTEALRKAALRLGITSQSLVECTNSPNLPECQKRLEALKIRTKKAYKLCAFELHPDRTGNDPKKTKLFQDITFIWKEIEKLTIGKGKISQPRVTVIRVNTWNSSTVMGSTTTWGGWRSW